MSAPKIKRRLYSPEHPLGPSVGEDVVCCKHGLRKYELAHLAEPPFSAPPYDDTYGFLMDKRISALRAREHFTQRHYVDQQVFDVLWRYMDAYRRLRYRLFRVPDPPTPVPALGPVYLGSQAVSILDHSLTHETSGIDGFPAFDDGWVAGRTVLAVEELVVTEQSGSLGGDAFYARGESSIEYWYGHLVSAPATGRRFAKGDHLGTIANIPLSDGGPHVHLGINARPLIGHELLHHTDYSSGAPTVGEQLRDALR